MIANPYPIPTSDDDKATTRFQTYLSAEDKGLLFGIRPIRGTIQAVVNNLIRNLCNDLRDLELTSYHPDADSILAILIERRDLTNGQLERIRCAVVGTNKQVPTGVQHNSGGTSVRKGLANPAVGPDHPTFQVVRGKQQNSTKKSKKTTRPKNDGR